MKTRSKKGAGKRNKKQEQKFAALIFSLINCGNDCDADLPEVSFATCDPEVNESQISKLRIAKKSAADFADWTQAAEWGTRISANSTDPDAIRELNVVADKPKPEATKKTISGNREIVTGKKHTINFDIDESNAINHEFVRGTKCVKTVKAWYGTIGGLLFGGNSGIAAQMEVDMTLGRNQGDIILYQGTLTWNAMDLEERCTDPVAE